MHERIAGTLKLLVTDQGRDYRHEQPMELQPAYRVTHGWRGMFIVAMGLHRLDPAAGDVVFLREHLGQWPYWTLYYQRLNWGTPADLYMLARKPRRTAHEIIDDGMPHFGRALDEYLARIDAAEPWSPDHD